MTVWQVTSYSPHVRMWFFATKTEAQRHLQWLKDKDEHDDPSLRPFEVEGSTRQHLADALNHLISITGYNMMETNDED